MTSLLFHDLPPGPTPLFLGETLERVAEVGRLLLDHATRTVCLVPNDPYEMRSIPEHSRQRFAVWEIEALMPRRQLVALYEAAKPLLERLQLGTTLVRGEDRWLRTRTPEADAADLVIGDLTAQPSIAPVEWIAAPRLTNRQETALEHALRIHGQRPPVLQSLSGEALEKARRQYDVILGHIEGPNRWSGLLKSPKDAGKRYIGQIRLGADVTTHRASRREAYQVKERHGDSRGTPLEIERVGYLLETGKRRQIDGQWAKLFEAGASPRYFI